jgi:hypothetical protein
MALDNDNPKTNEGTNEDKHTDKKIDIDMKDLFDTERKEEVEDFGFTTNLCSLMTSLRKEVHRT